MRGWRQGPTNPGCCQTRGVTDAEERTDNAARRARMTGMLDGSTCPTPTYDQLCKAASLGAAAASEGHSRNPKQSVPF